MSRSCRLLSASALTSLLSQGYTQIGGPYVTEDECLANCSQGTGTGTGTGTDAIADDLQHYWGMDDGSGVVVLDSGLGTPLNGTMSGGTWIGSPLSCSTFALRFDTNQIVTLASSSILNSLREFTVMSWVKLRNVGAVMLGASGLDGWHYGIANDGTSNDRKQYFGKSGSGSLGAPVSPAVYSNTALTPEVWHHVAITSDGIGTVKFYLDGVFDGGAANLYWTLAWTGVANYYFGGTVGNDQDELRVYDRALSQIEIQAVIDDCGDTDTGTGTGTGTGFVVPPGPDCNGAITAVHWDGVTTINNNFPPGITGHPWTAYKTGQSLFNGSNDGYVWFWVENVGWVFQEIADAMDDVYYEEGPLLDCTGQNGIP